MFQATTATRKIIQLTKRLRCIAGGTSASKTISILMWLIHYAQTNENKLISVVSESFPHLKRGAIRDFLNIMQSPCCFFAEDDWNKTDFIYTFPTKSKIEFFSADQPNKVRGPRRDALFINEANNVSYETYTQLAVRTNEVIWLDWNPVSEFWYYTEIKNKIDHDFITLTYKDNEALHPAIIQEIESRRDNKNWWKVYGEGQLGEIEGRIYTGWQIIDSIPHEARLERYGLDFGYSCFIGDTKVKCINGDQRIADLKPGDLVLTRLGYRRVKNVFNNGEKQVVEKQFLFNDGSTKQITGTPDHNFNINNQWGPLEKIQREDRLFVLKEENITASKVDTISLRNSTQRLNSIGKCIEIITGIFQSGITFITLTAILLITIFQIWLLSVLQNILEFTIRLKILDPFMDFLNSIGLKDGLKSLIAFRTKSDLVNGARVHISQQTHIKDSVRNLVIIVGNIKQTKIKQLSYAKTAIKGLWGISILNRNRVLSPVPINSLFIKEVKTIRQGIERVYNLEVEGIHEYFANGMLVYNCDPTAIVGIYYYNSGYILDEVTYQKGLSNKQIADILKNIPQALVIADSAEPKSIDELMLYGINILPSNKGPGSVSQGIQKVQDQRISVTKHSINLIKEYRNAIFAVDKNGKTLSPNIPDPRFSNHALDAGRYAMESIINPISDQELDELDKLPDLTGGTEAISFI